MPFIQSHAPGAITPLGATGLAQFAGKRIAIDVPVQMYRAVNVKGGNDVTVWCDWFTGFHRRILRDGVTPVYVFDGARVAAKDIEIAKRAEASQRACQRAVAARARFASVHGDMQARVVDAVCCGGEGAAPTHSEGPPIVMSPIERAARAGDDVTKAEARTIKPQREHYDAVREHLTRMGAECVVAPTEAEKECAFMCAEGAVDVVLTNDTDALPFGAPLTLFQFGRPNAYLVRLDRLLAELRMDLTLFRHFCIMCGCDFVKRVPGVGPAKAFGMLTHATRGGSIDAVLAYHETVRDVRFTEDILREHAATTQSEVDALETMVMQLREGMQDAQPCLALTTQLSHLAAQLDAARETHEDADKAWRGLVSFKERYPTAISIFTNRW